MLVIVTTIGRSENQGNALLGDLPSIARLRQTRSQGRYDERWKDGPQ